MQVNHTIVTIMTVIIATIMIASVMIPTISSISDKKTPNTGYDDQLRYSRISIDDEITISITGIDDEIHLYVNGVDYSELFTYAVVNIRNPIIITDLGWIDLHIINGHSINTVLSMWDSESNKFISYNGSNSAQHADYVIEIRNGIITVDGFTSADGSYNLNYGYVVDYDGKYGLYPLSGNDVATISANSKDVLIERSSHYFQNYFDVITVADGSILSQYEYSADGYSSEINATVNATDVGGLVEYTVPFKPLQYDDYDDSVCYVIGPISGTQGNLNPVISSIIWTIPLIMFVGLLIAVASTTVLHLRS